MNIVKVAVASVVLFTGCASDKYKPVGLYPEDQCGWCRMAVSERQFASQILLTDGTIFKFDDIRCLRAMRMNIDPAGIGAVYFADVETGEWLSESNAIVIETGMHTPMGSGLVAASSRTRADSVLAKYPPAE